MVFGQQLGEVLHVVAVLGDDAARRGREGRVQRGEAGVAAEDAEDADALMRADGAALAVDRVLGPGDGGGEADAVFGALDVVVHGLGHGDDVHAGVMQRAAVAQRVVAADGDEVVQPQRLDVVHHQGRDVVAVLAHLHRLGLGLARGAPAGPPSSSCAGWCASCAARCRRCGRWCGCCPGRVGTRYLSSSVLPGLQMGQALPAATDAERPRSPAHGPGT